MMEDPEDKTRASEEALGELHKELATKLTSRIKSGEATAADFTAAINFLRANDIKAIPSKKSPLARLGAAVKDSGVTLPFEGSDQTH